MDSSFRTPTKAPPLGGFEAPASGSRSMNGTPPVQLANSFNSTSLLMTPDRGEGTPQRQGLSDRFIPDRDMQDNEMGRFHLITKENATPPSLLRRTPGSNTRDGPAPGSPLHPQGVICEEPYADALGRTLFPAETTQNSVLGMQHPNHQQAQGRYSEPALYEQSFGLIYNENRQRNFKSRNFRVIPQTPERILDAPELLDDFYLNLVDWSSQNIMTVALGNTVYLWNAESGAITQLYSCPDRENIITGVSWHQDGRVLAIGTQDCEVQMWDCESQQRIRTDTGHTARVGSLHWHGNFLASGSRDTTIRIHDIRDQGLNAAFQVHTQEVCGLRWSPQGNQLASGGNDNLLCVWDFRYHGLRDRIAMRPLFEFQGHKAAIKALAWNPVQPNLLVSGGGTADKTLKFWNTATGTLLHTVDTKSQVCGVLWNRAGNELVSSHGYSDNQLTLWKYPSLRRTTDLTGHNSRVLHLAMSPDGQMVVSAAGDETIRFWRCFGPDRRSGGTPGQPSPSASPSAKQNGPASPASGAMDLMGTFDDALR